MTLLFQPLSLDALGDQNPIRSSMDSVHLMHEVTTVARSAGFALRATAAVTDDTPLPLDPPAVRRKKLTVDLTSEDWLLPASAHEIGLLQRPNLKKAGAAAFLADRHHYIRGGRRRSEPGFVGD
jgi:hypothetical protein